VYESGVWAAPIFRRYMKKIIRFFKNPFTKKLPAPINEPLNWGFIIPHTYKAQGAVDKAGTITEYEFAIEMVENTDFHRRYRESGGVSGAASRLSKMGCNASIEPHLNAFNGRAKGFEILAIAGDSRSISEGIRIAKAFKERFPDRVLRHGNGVKIVHRGDRGYKNLEAARFAGMSVALLSEAFFLDNPDEWIDHQDMASFWESVL
jgi:hypothetical protein